MASEHVAARCENCPECTVQCPYGVQVLKRMKLAQELFA
jgi:predicted aldo/keto reductase-like oxidoreductase